MPIFKKHKIEKRPICRIHKWAIIIITIISKLLKLDSYTFMRIYESGRRRCAIKYKSLVVDWKQSGKAFYYRWYWVLPTIAAGTLPPYCFIKSLILGNFIHRDFALLLECIKCSDHLYNAFISFYHTSMLLSMHLYIDE